MPRTKPGEALSKIIAADKIRRDKLAHDPEFQQHLEKLEVLAQRLERSASVPVSKLKDLTDEDLLLTPEESAFHDEAEQFQEKWGFRPRYADGSVELFSPSPVSLKVSLKSADVIGATRSYENHSASDVDALERHYREVREGIRKRKGHRPPARHRVRTEPQELRVKALAMKKKGWTLEQITKALFKKYKPPPKKRWKPDRHPRYRDTFNKYIRPPFSLSANAAIRRAEEELRQSHRSEAAENRKLRERVRRLLRPS